MPENKNPEMTPEVRAKRIEPAKSTVGVAKAMGQRNEGSRSAQPYVPIVDQTGKHSRGGWWKWLAIGILVAGMTTGAYYFRGPLSGGVTSAPAATNANKQLQISSADIDTEATALARQIIANDPLEDQSAQMEKSPAAQFTGAKSDPGVQQSGAAPLPEVARAATQQVARRKMVGTVLAHSTPAVRQEIASGRQAIFTLHLIDNMVEDGDAVILYVNGISYGRVDLTNRGQNVLVALPVGLLSQMRVLAVEDGGGGVTFGATSSIGDVRSKVMDVGDSDNWTVVPR